MLEMTTIRIAEDPRAKGSLPLSKREKVDTELSVQRSRDDGIYNIRSLSKVASRERWHDEDPGLRKEGDFKQKQVWASPMTSLGTNF